jgi:hypothetical protein
MMDPAAPPPPPIGHARLLQAEGLLPGLYPAALAEALSAARVLGTHKGRGKSLLMDTADLRRAAAAVRPAPLPGPPAAAFLRAPLLARSAFAPAAAVAASGIVEGSGVGARVLEGSGSLPTRLFAPTGLLGSGGGGGGGGSGRSRSSSFPHGHRSAAVLPNIQRCGECRTCLNRSLKKACIRNKVRLEGAPRGRFNAMHLPRSRRRRFAPIPEPRLRAAAPAPRPSGQR